MAAPKHQIRELVPSDNDDETDSSRQMTSIGANLMLILRQLHGTRTPKMQKSQWWDAVLFDALPRAIHRTRKRITALDQEKADSCDLMLMDEDYVTDDSMRAKLLLRDAYYKICNIMTSAFSHNGKPYPPFRTTHMAVATKTLDDIRKEHAKTG